MSEVRHVFNRNLYEMKNAYVRFFVRCKQVLTAVLLAVTIRCFEIYSNVVLLVCELVHWRPS